MAQEFEIIGREPLSSGFLKLNRYRLARTVPGETAGCGGQTVVARECIEGLRAAAVLPYDPLAGCIVLVEQMRVGALGAVPGGLVLEPPGGVIEAPQSAAATARREAWEEAGCRIGAMTPIGVCRPSPGISDESVALFCGEVRVAGLPRCGGDPREGEWTRVLVWDLERAIRELGREPLTPATLIIAVQWLALNRHRVADLWAADADGSG